MRRAWRRTGWARVTGQAAAGAAGRGAHGAEEDVGFAREGAAGIGISRPGRWMRRWRARWNGFRRTAIADRAAEPREFSGLVEVLPERAGRCAWPVHWARRGGIERPRSVAGGEWRRRRRGRPQAVDAAQRGRKLDLICSMGFCGALDPTLCRSAIFSWPTRVAGVRPEYRSPARVRTPASPPGVLASIDHVAQTAEEKRELARGGRRRRWKWKPPASPQRAAALRPALLLRASR